MTPTTATNAVAMMTQQNLFKFVIQDDSLPNLMIDARILLIENYLRTGNNDEAIAATFEILPDAKAEKNAGLKRASDAIGIAPQKGEPNLTQQIKLYTLRG